jgi:hypothetical protein
MYGDAYPYEMGKPRDDEDAFEEAVAAFLEALYGAEEGD